MNKIQQASQSTSRLSGPERSKAIRAGYWYAVALMALFLVCIQGTGVQAANADWHFVVRPAAVVSGGQVLLGEIADPVGNIHPQNWKELAATPLWAAPPRRGRAMNITRVKRRKALRNYLGDLADLAVLPPSLALQVGGGVMMKPKLHQLVVKSLTPYLAEMDGEPELRDLALPEFMFTRDARNTVELEPPRAIKAGSIGIRLREVDPSGRVVRRVTGGAFLNVWVTVPAAAIPVNRNDPLTPDKITHVRKNLAYLRGEAWDGRGGPWRVIRAIGTGSVIYPSDLERLPVLVKGTKIALKYHGETVRLTVPAEAMEDGTVGDVISVRNLQTRRQVYGTIVDPGTVVVSN